MDRFTCLWILFFRVSVSWMAAVCNSVRRHCEWVYLSSRVCLGWSVWWTSCLSFIKGTLWVGLPVCGALPTRWDCEWAHLSSSFHSRVNLMDKQPSCHKLWRHCEWGFPCNRVCSMLSVSIIQQAWVEIWQKLFGRVCWSLSIIQQDGIGSRLTCPVNLLYVVSVCHLTRWEYE